MPRATNYFSKFRFHYQGFFGDQVEKKMKKSYLTNLTIQPFRTLVLAMDDSLALRVI